MGLGFLGGLGTAVAAGKQGWEQAEDRAYQQRQREFQASQQQRTLDEQKREDELRTGLQGSSAARAVVLAPSSAACATPATPTSSSTRTCSGCQKN